MRVTVGMCTRHPNILRKGLSNTCQNILLTLQLMGRSVGRDANQRTLQKPAAERYSSAISCHLAQNEEYRTNYSVRQFSVLVRGCSRQHLDVLKAVFIHHPKPVLCRQKTHVKALHLFRSVSSWCLVRVSNCVNL